MYRGNVMIIKTEEQLGFVTFKVWLSKLGMKKCNVKGCKEDPEAIILLAEGVPTFCLCSYHFRKGINEKTGWDYDLEFEPKKEKKP